MKTEKGILSQSNVPIAYTVAQLKGRRLRMARALTGFSRQELYEKIGIATSTIDTWESGRIELTEKSAVRICAALQQVGIYCSVEWLLTGDDSPPRMMDELEKSMMFSQEKFAVVTRANETAVSKTRKIPVFFDENIRRELSFFLTLHKKSIFCVVKTDFLNSRYKMGDCVAGVDDDVAKLVGKTIIAVLKNDDVILCKLVNHSENESVVFLSNAKPREKVHVFRAAEIIWHRMIKRFD
jgi:transcriptional regulator with XRE-family HTH domain